jgi:mannose-6-phosphate isomerase-like protein (cupin superfamily)
MAIIGKMITNSKNGQSYRFLSTAKSSGGKLLEMESVYPPNTREPILHYHPYQNEHFEILAGTVTVRMGDETKDFHQGDHLDIPAGTRHAVWNRTSQVASINWKVMPALDMEYLFETITGLANNGKTDEKSKPPLLQLALTGNHFSKVFRQAKPPFAIQKLVFYILTPFAWLAGFRPTYKKYLD